MDASDLLLYQIALQLGVLLWVAVPGTLIMLSAVMDPDMRRNKSSAHLVSTKDVGNSLAELGVGITVWNIHANQGMNIVVGGSGRSIWIWVGCSTSSSRWRWNIRMVGRRGSRLS
jgi:hypothetical protein